jgi:hypothetical protein
MGRNSVSYSESRGFKISVQSPDRVLLSPVVIHRDTTLNYAKIGYFHIQSNLLLADNPAIWC